MVLHETLLISLKELSQQLYGRDNHCDYLNGQVEELRILIETFKETRKKDVVFYTFLMDFCQRQVLRIAGELEQHKNSKPTYKTFGG